MALCTAPTRTRRRVAGVVGLLRVGGVNSRRARGRMFQNSFFVPGFSSIASFPMVHY